MPSVAGGSAFASIVWRAWPRPIRGQVIRLSAIDALVRTRRHVSFAQVARLSKPFAGAIVGLAWMQTIFDRPGRGVVRYAGWTDGDVVRARLQAVVPNLKADVAVQNYRCLVVTVPGGGGLGRARFRR